MPGAGRGKSRRSDQGLTYRHKISTVRSRGINISVIFQSIGQLENRYPDNQYLEILGNADTHIFLGCTDPLTASFISERAGTASVATDNIMKNKRTFQLTDYTPEYREARGENKRALLNPDEVLRLAHDEMLILMRGQKVLRAKKFDYTKHPESKKLTPTSIFDYNPRSFDPSRYSVKETHLNGVPVREEPKKAEEKQKKTQTSAADQQHVLAADGSQMGNQFGSRTKPKPMQNKPDIQ